MLIGDGDRSQDPGVVGGAGAYWLAEHAGAPSQPHDGRKKKVYFCKVCNKLDEEGISGHHTRCKPVLVANPIVVVNKAVANIPPKKEKKLGRTKDRHKNKEARLLYARNLMRERRAAKKLNPGP